MRFELQAKHRKLIAPAENGEILVDSQGSLSQILRHNARTLIPKTPELEEESESSQQLRELAIAARRELLHRAIVHTTRYCKVDLEVQDANAPIIVSGHQPELFHPGVWFKNLLLWKISNSLNGIPVNIIIDNDVPSNGALKVLAGDQQHPSVAEIPYSEFPPGIALEELYFSDRKLVDEFERRVVDCMRRHYSGELLLSAFCKQLTRRFRQKVPVGIQIARARHLLEMEHGIHNLEVPLSELCRSECFQRFVCLIINESNRFVHVYNSSLDSFRILNRIRSKTRPVTNLIQQDSILELPLWFWSKDNPVRRKLYVEHSNGKIRLFESNRI